MSSSTKGSDQSACATNCCLLFVFILYFNIYETESRQFNSCNIDVVTDGVVTAGGIVFQLCSKYDKQSLNFLLPDIVWSCIKLSTRTSQWCLITERILSEFKFRNFNVQNNDCVNRLIKDCRANVIRIYSAESWTFLVYPSQSFNKETPPRVVHMTSTMTNIFRIRFNLGYSTWESVPLENMFALVYNQKGIWSQLVIF